MIKGVSTTLALSVFTATLSAFTFGYHLGEVNQPREAMTRCPHGTGDCVAMSDLEWGLFVSIFLVGGTVAGSMAGALCQSVGPRRVLLLSAIIFVVAAAIQSTASSVLVLCLARLIGGVSAGTGTVAVPLYIAAVAPLNLRGALGALNQLAIVTGILASQILGALLFSASQLPVDNDSEINSSIATYGWWRTLFASAALPPVVQLLLLPLCVESPRWLVSHHLHIDARKALARLRAHASEQEIQAEFDTLVPTTTPPPEERDHSLQTSRSEDDVESGLMQRAEEHAPLTQSSFQHPIGISGLFSVPSLRRPLLASLGIQIIQQFSGINAAVFYSTTIFNQSYSPDVAIKLTLLISVVNLAATVLSLSLIEKLGRKILLLTSELGMMFCGFLVFASVKLDLSPSLIVIGLMGFVGFFGVGLGAITWLIIPELIPAYAVNAAVSLCSATNWASSWLVAFLVPIFIGYLGYDIFLVFSILLAGFTYFTFTFIPETKGLSPEEVARVNRI
ncbi:Solute carrier 2, facilitated glucose transporter member 4 [Physocladia obscura]|uniref:Solute carrier 2, facilitated glucose transporter member 4 n=1 Tax=Physocladia obscura TaxID=109957 RepID=A0AAD5SZF0_9FUNG|nr:Solute carrier 2, facilitated glucose transporter member 4 [Physocladia obscura]